MVAIAGVCMKMLRWSLGFNRLVLVLKICCPRATVRYMIGASAAWTRASRRLTELNWSAAFYGDLMMSTSDPIMFAALASRMSDDELRRSIRRLGDQVSFSDYQLALIDEARLRGIVAVSTRWSSERKSDPEVTTAASHL